MAMVLMKEGRGRLLFYFTLGIWPEPFDRKQTPAGVFFVQAAI
jgi:hypothetical protein